jgi:insulysin
MNKLELIFPMKSYLSRFEEKPFTYLSSLIGHESEGSILYVLKARSWANSLSAGPTHRNRDFDMFQVTIDLTEEGLDHVNEVVDIVFQYIDMLRLEGPNKAQYDEIAKVQNLNFRFQERSQPLNYAIFIATQLNKVPPQLVISAAYLMQKWCPELITEVLEFLTPKNMILHQISKAYENNAPQREKWYNTAYNEEQLADAFVNSWCHESKSSIMPSIHYPAPNSFVPENFDIFKDSEQSEKEESGPLNLPGGSPSLIVNTEQMRLWHHQDKKFNRPRATINVRLMSPVIFQMHSGRVLAEMFAFVVTEVVNAYSYFAEIAGMDFSISAAKFSIEGIFRGYNDKLATFAVTMLKELRNYTTTRSSERQEQVFRRVQARYRKRLLNFPNEAPYQHGMVNCDLATMNIACDAKAKLKTLEALQPADLVAFSELFFNNLFVEMLIAGNVTKVKAIETGTKIFKELKAKPTSADELHAPRHVSLPAGSSFYHEDTEENPNQPCGAINIFFQIGFDNHCSRKEFSELAGIDLALLGDRDPLQVIGSVPLRVKAATIFLVHLMREPMYDMLRTKETLGYIVHVGDCSRWGSIGVRFIIQADKASPKYMDNRVEAFIESYRKILTDLSEEQFNVNRNAILTNLLEKPKKSSTSQFAILGSYYPTPIHLQ